MNLALVRDTGSEAAALAEELKRLTTADAVDKLNGLDPVDAAAVIARLEPERAIDILESPELDGAASIVSVMPDDVAARLLGAIASDRAADIFGELDEPIHEKLIGRLAAQSRRSIEKLLDYPEGTAGAMMTTEFVSVPADFTVAQTLEHVRRVERTRETVYAIYVLDPLTRELVQVVTLRRLITGEPQAPVLSIAPGSEPVTVNPLTDQEDVARLIRRHDLLALPVVDARRHVLGIVTVDDVIDAMIDETTEDVQKFGGMAALDRPYMQIGFFSMIGKRAGWLLILFISEMLTANAMQHFQNEIASAVVLALFIPLIVSSGGNSGSQATSLLIRELALGTVKLGDWWRVALKEAPTGVVLGAILGVIGIARVAIWQLFGLFDYGPYWELVALTIGASLVGIVTFGSLVGSMLPFALKRVGLDPASASAPLVATLVDVTGLVIYFEIALIILRGTIL